MFKHPLKNILSVTASALLLSACHHDNPLKTHTKKQSATFLMNASANVEKRLRFDVRKDEHGYGYLECMEGKKNPEIHCRNLYQGMLVFAKENHYPGFETLQIEEMLDQSTFAGLSDDYYEIMATTWPNYVPAG